MVSTIGACAQFGASNLHLFLETIGHEALSVKLARRRLSLFGRIARQPNDSLMRSVTFCPGELRPATDRFVRKVGRPHLEWTTEVRKLAIKAARSMLQLEQIIYNEGIWENCVAAYYT